MKKNTLLFIAVVFSLNSYSQQYKTTPSNKKTEKTPLTSDSLAKTKLAVTAYDVKETINMKFGGRITTYTVPTLDLVETNELGPDNTRVVKPKYTKVKVKEEIAPISKPVVEPAVTATTLVPPVSVKEPKAKNGKLIYKKIKIIESYERVLDKGYITEDMLKQVADYYFFQDDLVSAEKWYFKLFEFCPDEIDALYYFRYAKSLESTGQMEKAKKMMNLYQSKKM